MGNLETLLIPVEAGLESEDYDRVLNSLNRIMSENPLFEQEEDSYLIHFFSGQAIFRREMDLDSINIKELLKSKDSFEKSLKLKPNFADSHFLLGCVYMVISKHNSNDDKVFSALSARYHLNEAKKLKQTLFEETSPKLVSLDNHLNRTIYDITLCSTKEDMQLEWMIEFEKFPWINIVHSDITQLKADAIVSPANSFGFMDGGLDYKLREYFGADLEANLQKIIREKHNGELLVGNAEIIETNKREIPYLISAPTMRVPMPITNTMNPYLATRAVFIAIENFNLDGKKINSVLMPSMGTGVGEVPLNVSARQMRAAYEDIVLKRVKFPKDFCEAQQKHRVLSMLEYWNLYGGKY